MRIWWLAACALALAILAPGWAAATVLPEAPTVISFHLVKVVPVQPLAEILGAAYTQSDGTLTIKLGVRTFIGTLNNTEATANGAPVTLPIAPYLQYGVVYAPLEALVTALGGTMTLETDAVTQAQAARLAFGGTRLALPVFVATGEATEFKRPGFEIYQYDLATKTTRQLSHALGDVMSAEVMRDGTMLVFDRAGHVYSRPLSSTTATNLTSAFATDDVQSVLPAPCADGSLLFLQSPPPAETPDQLPLPGICQMRVDGSAFRRITRGTQPLQSADGAVIAHTVRGADGKINAHVIGRDGANDRDLGEGIALAISPDGTVLAYVSFGEATEDAPPPPPTLRLVTIADNAPLAKYVPVNLAGPQCHFTPDGQHLIYMGLDGIHLLTLAEMRDKLLVAGRGLPRRVSPDGKSLIMLRGNQAYLVSLAGGEPQPVAPELYVRSATFTPDGGNVLLVGVPMELVRAVMGKPQPPTPAADRGQHAPPTDAEIAAARQAGTRQVIMKTAKGDIEIELYGAEAPLTVANFIKLAKSGFYDGLTFHRVEKEPTFSLIQGGDPSGNGSGGPGYTIKREISPKLRHVPGALAMARTPDPDSAGCQFYIGISALPMLDNEYAVFGKVTKGLDIVKQIAVGDKIVSVTVK